MATQGKLIHLLEAVNLIREKYEKQYIQSGLRFNVFNILGLSADEVRTHSAFLGELLNPKGSHGQKDTFLKLFIESLPINNFNSTTATVALEKHIGYLSDDSTEGGRLDIIISDESKNAIIIENKIYAGDKPCQLLRYYNYGRKYYTTSKIVYLTLTSQEPNDNSTAGLTKSDYLCITYEKHIDKWLDQCELKSNKMPLVKETIVQYRNLIKELTGQSTNIEMNTEIVRKIVSNEENIKTFFEMRKKSLMTDLCVELSKKLEIDLQPVAVEFKLKLELYGDFGCADSGICFYISNSTHNYYIDFGFCKDFTQFVYGISNEKQKYPSKHQNTINKRIGAGLGWSTYLWLDNADSPYTDWNEADTWIAIMNGSCKNYIRERISFLLENLKEIEI